MNKSNISSINERAIVLNNKLLKYFSFLGLITMVFVIIHYYLKLNKVGLPNFADNFEASFLIGIILDFLSVFISWFFLLWAFTFIPALVIYSTQASKEVELTIKTDKSKYWQLFFIMLFPSVIFAFLWLSLPPKDSNIEFPIGDIRAFLFAFASGIAIFLLLKGITKLIDIKKINFYISFFLILIYFSLILNYGFGFNEISFGTLFGILGFLAWDFSLIKEFGKRLTLYDLPDKFIQSLEAVDVKINETNELILENEATRYAIDQEHQIAQTKKLMFDADRVKSEQERLNKIQILKNEYTKDADRTRYAIITDKVDYLSKIHSLLSEVYTDKINREIPEKLEALRASANQTDPKELIKMLDAIYNEMEAMSGPIPDKLDILDKQMEDLVKKIEQADSKGQPNE